MYRFLIITLVFVVSCIDFRLENLDHRHLETILVVAQVQYSNILVFFEKRHHLIFKNSHRLIQQGFFDKSKIPFQLRHKLKHYLCHLLKWEDLELADWANVVEALGTLLSVKEESVSVDEPRTVIAHIVLYLLLLVKFFGRVTHADEPLLRGGRLELIIFAYEH